jgi:4-amino-4-deoxy-L-arabinose transferase-like glycosyltransferase
LALGAAIGLAFLAKYTGVLLVPMALGYLAASPGMRRWLKRPSLYLGGLVALGVALPVVLWNAYQGWPTLTLHLVERNAPVDAGTMIHNALNVLVGQATAYNPLLFVGLMSALGVALRRARTDERYRFVTWTSAPVLAFILIAMSRVRDPEAHWTMTAFVPVAVAAGGWLDERFQLGPVGELLKNYLRVGAAMSVIVALIGYVHFRTDWLLHVIPGSSYDPNRDASTELVGWQQVREAIQTHADRLGRDTVVASCQYAL